MVLSPGTSREKDKLGPCPQGNYSVGTDICDHYFHFIIEEPES